MTAGPLVAIVMGSQSDWPTMSRAADMLDKLGVAYDARIVSAHRTPERLVSFAQGAAGEGFKVVIAGAGGAATGAPGTAATGASPCRCISLASFSANSFSRPDRTDSR
jgi:phosphoribosylaminoimidazole carboxylase PurE protein